MNKIGNEYVFSIITYHEYDVFKIQYYIKNLISIFNLISVKNPSILALKKTSAYSGGHGENGVIAPLPEFEKVEIPKKGKNKKKGRKGEKGYKGKKGGKGERGGIFGHFYKPIQLIHA